MPDLAAETFRKAQAGVRAALPALRRLQGVAARPVLARRAQRSSGPQPERWGIGNDGEGRRTLNGVVLTDLVGTYGSPLHVVDLDRLETFLRSSADSARDSKRHIDLLAAHPVAHVNAVVGQVALSGWGMWTASSYELQAALHAGMPASRIVHAPRVLGAASAEHAIAAGVGVVCGGSTRELAHLTSVIDRSGDDETRIGLTLELAVPGSDDEQRATELRTARTDLAAMLASVGGRVTAPTHLHLRCAGRRVEPEELDGIADHIGEVLSSDHGFASVSLSVELRPDTVEYVNPLRARLNQSFAVPLAITPRPVTDLAALAVRVSDRIAVASGSEFDFAFDPGGFTTASTQFTLATVIDVDPGTTVDHVVLDAGINLADDTLVEHHHLIAVTSQANSATAGELRPYRFAGPICTPADVLYANQWMAEISNGDVMAMMDTGGTYVAASTNFSFPRPAVVGIRRTSGASLLRAGEQFEDLVALDEIGL